MTRVLDGYLSVNGVRLHYIEQGDGPPILFLHGFPEFSGAWHGVMTRLSPRFRTIAIDTRGVNLSDAPADVAAYTFDELVEDVRQVIGALGNGTLTLVGHDWGGFIAWELAIRHPELLDRLIIINTGHNGIFDQLVRSGGAQAAASKYMLAFRSVRGEEIVSRNDFAGFRKEIIEPAMKSGSLSPDQAEAYVAAWRRPQGLTPSLNYYRANKSGPPSGDDTEPRELDKTIVHVPTLAIWGERDSYFTMENVELLPRVVPNLIVRRFPDSGHWIVHQRPSEIAALISDFIDGRLEADNGR